MSGYKLGGHINIGYNPNFDPAVTDQYASTGANATIVAGEGNTLKGLYNYSFGRDNQILGETGHSHFVAGTGNVVSGNTHSHMVLGKQNTMEATASYSTAFGYLNKIKDGSAAAIVGGIGANVSGIAAIGIGYLANATGSYALAMGKNSKASAASAMGLGTSGTGSATNALGIMGNASAVKAMAIGSGATASASGSIAIGRGTMGAGRLGGIRFNANGAKSTTDSYQICQSIGATTDATPTKIFLASGGSTDGNFVIDTSTCVHFDVIVQGTDDSSSTVGCIYRIEGVVNRDNNGSNNPAFLGTPSVTVIHEENAGMDAAISIDNTNKCLDLTVTGKAGTNLNWLATWHVCQNQ
tara:strand:+ start:4238 stop:5299 length:1062 start_codon:yes stop_codon:yes gene_type:complete